MLIESKDSTALLFMILFTGTAGIITIHSTILTTIRDMAHLGQCHGIWALEAFMVLVGAGDIPDTDGGTPIIHTMVTMVAIMAEATMVGVIMVEVTTRVILHAELILINTDMEEEQQRALRMLPEV